MSTHVPEAVTREELIQLITRKPVSRTLKLLSLVLAAIGIVIFIAGAVTGNDRVWLALHFNWLFFTTVSSAGVAFAAVQRLTTARWSRPVVRLVEGFVAWLPIGYVLLLLILFPGAPHIFSWAKEAVGVPHKAIYLDPTFFRLRGIIVYGALTLFSVWFVYRSVRLDVGLIPEDGARWAANIRAAMRRNFGDERRELHRTHSILGVLAVAVVMLYGYGWIVMSWDYSMTLSLHFQSTMYGWQFFMSSWLVMLAVLAVFMRFWKTHLNDTALITDVQYHDVGKLIFAFTAFWGYLTFGQYLVIWYGNLPEETHYFRLRLIPPWAGLTTATLTMMFVVPFFTMLSKAAKIYSPVMATVAFTVILGLWFHRYLEVYPSAYGEVPTMPFGFWEIGIGLGMLGLWGITYLGFMDAFPKVRVAFLTSPYRDEVQVPVDPRTMEPLPAHE